MSNPEDRSSPSYLWKRVTGSLSSMLLLLLVSSMALVFGVLGYLNIQLHRTHL